MTLKKNGKKARIKEQTIRQLFIQLLSRHKTPSSGHRAARIEWTATAPALVEYH